MNRGIQLINNYYGIDIREKSRVRNVCRRRQMYFYCVSRVTSYSLREIAQHVGLKSHANILYAIETIRNECEFNKEMRIEIEYLVKEFDKIYSIKKVKNISSFQYEFMALWLKSQRINIDLNSNNWMQDNISIKAKDLIDILLKHENEIIYKDKNKR
jgi:hypothetical protein